MTQYIATVDDVYGWFPELHEIANERVRRMVAEALYDAPEYFWSAKASTYFHPNEHAARHGLVLHTKRACSVFERVVESMEEQKHFTDNDADYGRAALLLHDTHYYGAPPTETGGKPETGSDKIAASYYRQHHDLPVQVIEGIAAAKGVWGHGPNPRTHLQQIIHVADQLSSTDYISIGVKEPNSVLTQQFPDIETR
jgi:hypothetical protein